MWSVGEESRRFSDISPEQLVPFLEMEKPKGGAIWVGRYRGKGRVPVLGRFNLRGLPDVLGVPKSQ